MNQADFLRVAKRILGLSYPELATELGVSPRTMEKWARDAASADHREMPLIARKFIARLLEEAKQHHVLSGDRATAETVDALLAHIAPERFQEALRTFDALQTSANALVPMNTPPDWPRYFKTLAEKNAWAVAEEIRLAQATRKKSAIAG